MKYRLQKVVFILVFVFLTKMVFSQVVYSIPEFPNQDDDITIFFNASLGNKALQGFTGDVYTHTGVITNRSNHENDWRHVVGNWGTNDSRVLMKREGEDLYSLSFNIQTFYNLEADERVNKLAFVFRNRDGSVVGRNVDGSDIFHEIYDSNAGLIINILDPTDQAILYVGDEMPIQIRSNVDANFEIKLNGQNIYNVYTDEVDTTILLDTEGKYDIEILVFDDTESFTSHRTVWAINPEIEANDPSLEIDQGLTRVDDRLFFSLTAPNKDHVFLLCPVNDFQPSLEYRMTPSVRGDFFWIDLPISRFENENALYQYLVDGEIVVADPYSTCILDPVFDAELQHSSLEYPQGAKGHVSVIDVWDDPYQWSTFESSPAEDLIIYELLMRDFVEDRQYTTIIDSLDYLQNLGINAIELMPVQEFEGNQSWGYNPSYHMALDKAYGTKDDFKKLIDECHKRGIAVILDVVYNHAFSQSPFCQLYWDQSKSRPTEDNPWLNVEAKHPFNVGYDFNHESEFTKNWVKQVLAYWIEEYNVDGFRFDLSKGFTQKNSVGNPDLMARYDQSRIDILTEYAEHIWSFDADIYVIMEHFADNDEEQELADQGMLLWNNIQFQFAEAAMGYNSNLRGADYSSRGMNKPSLITYLESHDEERLGYKISQWGNSNGNYDTKEFSVLTERIVAAYTIFMSIPGPKMVWQFTELAYDESINRCISGEVNDRCRLDPKPIYWQYLSDEDRNDLYQKLSALFKFKTKSAVFKSDNFQLNNSDPFLKLVSIVHEEMDLIAIANFDTKSRNVIVDFSQLGTWHEFFTGKELEVGQTSMSIDLNPGGYKIFTSSPSDFAGSFTTSTQETEKSLFSIFPNPISDQSMILLTEAVDQLELIDAQGRIILNVFSPQKRVSVPPLNPGLYFVKAKSGKKYYYQKIIKL